jgi:hypothetical protein
MLKKGKEKKIGQKSDGLYIVYRIVSASTMYVGTGKHRLSTNNGQWKYLKQLFYAVRAYSSSKDIN